MQVYAIPLTSLLPTEWDERRSLSTHATLSWFPPGAVGSHSGAAPQLIFIESTSASDDADLLATRTDQYR